MSSIGDDVKVGKLTVLKRVEFQTDTDLEASRILVKDRFELGDGCEIVGLNETYATDQELATAEAHLQSNILVLQEKTDGLTSNLATEKTRIDGLVSSLSTTDAQLVNLNTTLGASVNALRTDVDSNASILSTLNYDVNTTGGVKSNVLTLQNELDALEAKTDLIDELAVAFDPDDPNQGTAIASLTGAAAGIAGSIYSSILTRGVASTQGQIIDILEDQFGDTLDNLSNVSNVSNKTTSDISALQDVVNLANWGTIPGSGTNYDYVITSPGNVGRNLTSNIIRHNHDLYGATGKISQISSNITTIKSNLYTHDVLIALNSNNLAQNVITINNLSSDYTALNSSVLGLVAGLGALTNSGGTIDTIQTDLSSNVTRIEALESNIGSSGGSNVTYTTVESNLATSTNVYIGDNLTMGEQYTYDYLGNNTIEQVRPNATLHIHGQLRNCENQSIGTNTYGDAIGDAHIMLTDTEYDPSNGYDSWNSHGPNGRAYQGFDGSRLHLWTNKDGYSSSLQSAYASWDYSVTSVSNVATRVDVDDFKTHFKEDPAFLLLNPKGGRVGLGTTNPQSLLHIVNPSTTSRDVTVNVFSGPTQQANDTSRATLELHDDYGNSLGWGGYIQGYHQNSVQAGLALGTFTGGSRDAFRMFIKYDGCVGIAENNPRFPLHANGVGPNTSLGASYDVRWFHPTHGILDVNSGHGGNALAWSGISIYGSHDICAGDHVLAHNGTIGGSDERIKKNIVDADDSECLEVLRQLKPKKYQYKDVINKGETYVWGFIAQEVANVLPHSTQLRPEAIPNIYELANVSASNVITFTNFDTSDLEANATTIRVMTIEDRKEDVTVAEVIDEHTIRVEEDLTDWIGSVDETGNVVAGGSQLFIYGQRVNDFCYLKKESIWTVATAALQEVDRQLQAEKARNDALEARLSALEALVQQP